MLDFHNVGDFSIFFSIVMREGDILEWRLIPFSSSCCTYRLGIRSRLLKLQAFLENIEYPHQLEATS